MKRTKPRKIKRTKPRKLSVECEACKLKKQAKNKPYTLKYYIEDGLIYCGKCNRFIHLGF